MRSARLDTYWRPPILTLALLCGCQASIPIHSLTSVANQAPPAAASSPLFLPVDHAATVTGMPAANFDRTSPPDALRPKSGIWSFATEGDGQDLPHFELVLDFKSDGSIVVTGTPTAPRLVDNGPLESYLRSNPTADGEQWVAYLQVDRLYRLKLLSPTTMAGEAWFGIRPPEIVPVRAEWLGPAP